MKKYIVILSLATGLANAAGGPLSGKTAGVSGNISLKFDNWKADGASSVTASFYNVDARAGFLLADGLIELGPVVGYEGFKLDTSKLTFLKVGVFADANFLVNDNIYLGPGVDVYYASADTGSGAAGSISGYGFFPNVGGKFFVGQNADINLKLGYVYEKLSKSGNNLTISGVDAKVGFGLYF